MRLRQSGRLLAMASRGWIQLGNVSVHPWTISGIESCVTVRLDNNLPITFDMGACTRESLQSQHVFISHGHIDHIGAIPQHAARRELFSRSPATYHMLPSLAPAVRDVCLSYHSMHEMGKALADIHIQEMVVGDEVKLPGGYRVVAFETFHRVQSQGYLVYSSKRTLKPQYKDLDSWDIGKLCREGCEVNDIVYTPQVAYTGDTMLDFLLKPSHEDLRHVQTLIMEATYIDDRCDTYKAHSYGHTHLHEIAHNHSLFDNIESIVLVHFSDRYSGDEILDTLDRLLPMALRQKVHVSSIAKELY